jgi:hypothetical protein
MHTRSAIFGFFPLVLASVGRSAPAAPGVLTDRAPQRAYRGAHEDVEAFRYNAPRGARWS